MESTTNIIIDKEGLHNLLAEYLRHLANGFSRKIGSNSRLAFFVSGPERTPNGSRTDPERTPNGPQTDPERIPNGPRTDPERTPNGPRADPERTPGGANLLRDSIRSVWGPLGISVRGPFGVHSCQFRSKLFGAKNSKFQKISICAAVAAAAGAL